MTSRLACGFALLPFVVVACSKTSPAKTPHASQEAGAEVGAAIEKDGAACTSDNCIVPLVDIEGVCGPRLKAATRDCPGVTVYTGACGALTHVVLHTVDPIQDCYYDTASGALVGGIVRSDAGFTKIAGEVPPGACPTPNLVCDHSIGGGGTDGGDASASDASGTDASDVGASGGDASARADGSSCPIAFAAAPGQFCSPSLAPCDYPEGRCACLLCQVTPELLQDLWSCRGWDNVETGCPSRSPPIGSSCDRPNLACHFGGSCSTPALGDDVVCQSGIWQKQMPTQDAGCAYPFPMCH